MLTVVLGGPNEYTGRDLATAHQPLGIVPAHYEAVGAGSGAVPRQGQRLTGGPLVRSGVGGRVGRWWGSMGG
ncbi:hypothetical protein [Micromonospora endophytica]|nr:hypothetical protein [Micromonospora endophytica]